MKYLIVANGPFVSSAIINELRQDKKIIALDGASIKLAKMGILPDIILGDLDSVSEDMSLWGIKQSFNDISDDTTEYQGKFGVTIVPAKNQDYTDLVKAIKYCDAHKASTIDIVCTIGGRMDHTLINLRALRTEYNTQRPINLYTESQMLTYAKNTTVEMVGKAQDNCGVMAFPQGSFSSNGLAWDGTNFPLTFGFSESVCNHLTGQQAQLTITGEALIIHPGPLQGQKNNTEADYYHELGKICDAMQFTLLEMEAQKLRAIKEIRKTIKKSMHISEKTKNLEGIYYLSHKKDSVYTSAQVGNNETVLVSVSPEKKHSWKYFNSILSGEINKDNLQQLTSALPEHYRKRILK